MMASSERTRPSADRLLAELKETRASLEARRVWVLAQPEPEAWKANYVLDIDASIADLSRDIESLKRWLDS
jgi:hypothetical protein